MEKGGLAMVKNSSEAEGVGMCRRLVGVEHHGLWYELIVGAPVLLFLMYLALRARRNIRKLIHNWSHLMATYYAFIWLVACLNLFWFILQMRQAKDGGTTLWNLIALTVSFGIVLLEVSVVVFLSQGYLVSGWDALLWTLLSSSIVAAVDTLLKAVYIFGFGVQLFLLEADAGDRRKWTFWIVRNIFFMGIYLFILVLPHTKLRDRLPARPSFYRYVFVLFLLNVFSAFGSILISFGTDFGYCLHGLALFIYTTFYPLLLYITFLADYFMEEDLRLDDIYYSEMKDAGFFDSWD